MQLQAFRLILGSGEPESLQLQAFRLILGPGELESLQLQAFRFILGPGEPEVRLWSRRRGSNIIKIDGWTLPGPSAPSLSGRHIWTHFGSILEDRFGTHFWSILETVLGLMLELIRDSFWSSFGVPEASRKVARRHMES